MEDLPSNLERLLDSIRLYERRKDASGNRPVLAEDIKVNVIERLVPAELERHLVLNRDRFRTFDAMLGEIQSYVEHSTGNRIKVVNSQGPGDPHGRPDDPMDVGSKKERVKRMLKGNQGRVSRPRKHALIVAVLVTFELSAGQLEDQRRRAKAKATTRNPSTRAKEKASQVSPRAESPRRM